MKKGKITIGYLRVSTEEQVRKGYSLKNQEVKIENYFKAMSMDEESVLNVIEDDGYSAGSEKRPGYQKMIELIKTGSVDSIIIHKIDRLSRTLLDFAKFIELCLEYDVSLISMNEKLDFSTALGRALASILLIFAQLEREQDSERTKQGYVGMLESGIYPFGGKLPLGISKDEDKNLFYNDDIEIVNEIFELTFKGETFAEITRIIKDKYKMYFSKGRVEKIVKNKFYTTGCIEYEDKVYSLIEPAIETTIEERTDVQKRRRHIQKHFYDFNIKNSKVTTKIKKVKTTGEMKEYQYYKNAITNEIYNANELKRKINKIVEFDNKEIALVNKRMLEKLTYAFSTGTLDKKQFDKTREKLTREKEKLYTYINIKEMEFTKEKLKFQWNNKEYAIAL